VLDPKGTPEMESMVAAAKAEGDATFHRKIEYLQEFGRAIGIRDVDAQVLSQVMLSVLDEKWKDHLYDLDQLRNAIHYRGWGQKDPLVEYKKEAYDMFVDLMHDIQSTFTERFLKVQVSADQPPPRPEPPPPPPKAEPTGPDDLFMGPSPREPARPPVPAAVSSARSSTVTSSLGPVGRTATAVPPVGRNDPCPCGSGKKYKKCHGAGQ
jgi:preprotein translocase subunit SecA